MKKIHRVLAMLMAAIMALSLITTAFAEPIIDPGKKASFSIYKYDITTASKDGAWDAESYVSTGLHDDAIVDKLAKYAIQGVEFTYLRVADITMNNELVDGQRQVGVLYGFDGSERSNAVLSAIGLTGADTHKTEGGINYFTSDMLNNKLSTALTANATTVKNSLETAVKSGGVAMPETDATGHTSASDMEQGLYLVVETCVPENVTSTCNPFFVSLPMTAIDGTAWNYDVTVYPKNQTGNPISPFLLKPTRHARLASVRTVFLWLPCGFGAYVRPEQRGHVLGPGIRLAFLAGLPFPSGFLPRQRFASQHGTQHRAEQERVVQTVLKHSVGDATFHEPHEPFFGRRQHLCCDRLQRGVVGRQHHAHGFQSEFAVEAVLDALQHGGQSVPRRLQIVEIR